MGFFGCPLVPLQHFVVRRGIRRELASAACIYATSRRFSAKASKGPEEHTESWRKPVTRATAFPDFIHLWTPAVFRRVGYGLGAGSVSMFAFLGPLAWQPYAAAALTAGYWYQGLSDLKQENFAIKRNFPVLGNFRYILEVLRPEIRQYFIESDYEPDIQYDRQHRVGYTWANHSIFPTEVPEENKRVTIGKKENGCKQPYSASLLNISGMSYGALSDNAILALNEGAKRGGFFHNTGEGGMSEFHLKPGGDLVWNIGTGYFGCGQGGLRRTFDPVLFKENAQREQCKMIELKLSQGAKPSHGGMLPKGKITKAIATARGLPFPAEEDCNSPPRHSAFSSPTGMMEFIGKLRELSGGKPVGFKLCVGQPEDFSAICHAMIETGIRPDFVTVDGSEGGTGAAPPEFSDSVGMPLQEGLNLVNNMLTGGGLRDKIRIIASGKILSGFSIVRTLALGADTCNAARAFMFSLGCIQALKCNTNMCPTGVTTQNPNLMRGLVPEFKSVRVASFHKETVTNAFEIIGAMGLDHPGKVTGEHVMLRVSSDKVRTFAERFPLVAPGVLLEKKGPPRLQAAWDLDDGYVQRSWIHE
uniref:Glutamate synthase domain-containing protein n=1 Tax=Chromera velia CCMP2878 TaxID=1169474 RepID=A0A0G4FIN9_9ALVE|eukprot:Cvel_17252.t1-p1 / transcript=Cvel_17252.t1 / gene=Cvel_17252 / organism=Chromera_velia_CCMP2878 / gene_product=Glutamate synthase large subunit-like protein YerD, putative / transcript_product=Glutamate synthase large subunit-like protein YerD, putative / location=Cvel_scaffold1366:36739-41648(-) / protein_length=586 / sequence_SO=supercontig / SO=protein_coding / is_pseudo=false